MSEIINATPDTPPPVVGAQPGMGKRIRAWAWHAFATFVWLYVIIKLFVFDIDNYLIGRFFPNREWLLSFKFFFIIGAIAAFILLLGRYTLFWMIYLLLYPFIAIFWKLPYLLFKQENWVLAFAVAQSIIVFCRSFAFNFVTSTFGLIAAAIALSSSTAPLLWASSFVLLAVTIVMYARRFTAVFRPTFAPEVYKRVFARTRTFVSNTYLPDDKIKALPVLTSTVDQLQALDKTDLDKWKSNLEISVLFNRASLFFAKKLRAYQRSGFPLVTSALTLVSLVFVTIVTFACINFALFHIDPLYFETSSYPSFFTFIWYSFHAMVFSSVKELLPVSPISQTVWMIEGMLSLFLIVILAALFFSHRSQRESAELNDVIAKIEEEGLLMEAFIKTQWHIETIDHAIVELTRLRASSLRLLLFFSERLK